MSRTGAFLAAVAVFAHAALLAGQTAGAGPLIVVETSKGQFSIRTFPREAPKTVSHVLALVRRGFYDGQRFHRAVPSLLIQWGDPRSRSLEREAEWGRGAAASSGTPIGAAEISKDRLHVAGSVGIAHPGRPAAADSQIYIMLSRRPELDGSYTVFGQVVAGIDVPARIERGDLVIRMYVRE
jgi:cyclophilin family peptidyl-prolyl cis-trans isomerase